MGQWGGAKMIDGHWGGNKLKGETLEDFPEVYLTTL